MLRSHSIVLSAAAALGLCLFGSQARAAFTIVVTQTGSNVTMTGTGSLNTSALTPYGTEFDFFGDVEPLSLEGDFETAAYLGPVITTYQVGDADNDSYYDVTFTSGPVAGFGNGQTVTADTGNGDFVGFSNDYGDTGNGASYPSNNSSVYLPLSYVSKAPLSDTDVFDNTTIADLGITPGTYTWTYGSGSTADSITLTTVSAVPEPASLSLLGVGAAALLGRQRKMI